MKPTAEFWRLLGMAAIIAASGWALSQFSCSAKFADPVAQHREVAP